ncbi:MAG: DUF4147 domain-containing protein, partial [Alphaproteobacteria bacterium]
MDPERLVRSWLGRALGRLPAPGQGDDRGRSSSRARDRAGPGGGRGLSAPVPGAGPWIAGAGKAAESMARGAAAAIPGARGVVVAPRRPGPGGARPSRIGGILVLRGEHPFPGAGSFASTRRLVAALVRRPASEPVLLLLSGGASALLSMPAAGLRSDDKARLHRLLFRSGLPIAAMNAVRKHASAVKGGGLLRLAAPRPLWTLAVSDVVGDDPATIGSGPGVADPSTFADALAFLLAAVPRASVPAAVLHRLERGVAGRVPETVKHSDRLLGGSRAVVLASNATALAAASRRARSLGWVVRRVRAPLEGEARVAAARFVAELPARPLRPTCVLAGGETVVTVRGGRGLGGRSQEFALAAAPLLARSGWTLLAAGTDGVDGPTPAAGALVDGTTARRAGQAAIDRALAAHDS